MNKKNYLFLCFLIVLFTTTGCGTGSSDSANPYIDDLNEKDRPSSPGDRLVTTTQESAGNNCLQGGFLVETGVDRNANSKLDTDEVTSQSYVCNGKRENSNGPQISLVSTSPEPSGDNCAQGGVLFETGIDLNSNSVLDKNEVASTSYLCNGLNGTDGKDGTSQLSLISIVAEPAGDNCPEGGVLLGTGMDLNGNSILDAEEIASSGYICNVTTSVPSDNNSPNPIAEVTYAKLLTNFFSETVSVDGTVNINIALEINSTGYNSDNPLVVKISDDQGYFPTKLYNISDFSSDSVLELVSRPFTEATTVTAQIKVEFCDNTTCDEKVYGTKTVTANITINPRFTSATVLTESIRSTVLVGQSNTLNLELNFDADGFNYFNPLYVMVSDGFQSIQTETFTLYDTSQQVTLAIDTLYLYEIGELNSNLSISVCKDYYCYEALQDTISIPINLTVRNPIVFSVPVEPTLSFSQTILESGTLEYEINLASEDTTSMPFWVKIYDPSGEYFQEKVVGSKYVSNIPIKVALEINPIDATASEARTFHIESKVCMDSSCTTVVSPEPGNTDVTLNVLYPSAEITINESAINVIGKDNTPAVTELSGSWQSNNMGSLSAYLVAMDSDGGSIVDNAALLPQQDSFTLPLELLPQTQMNSFSTDVSFKVCLEISCEHVIGSSANIVAVTYDVNQLAGWTTHQRNAQHNGYVPITLNSDNFAESWTWSRPSSTEPIGGINPVVAQDGKVVLSYDVYFGDALVVMLDEATGDKVWEANLGNMPALNPPAITEGKVWAATTGHEDTKLRAFDFNTGSQLHSSNFGGQWPHFFAPTPYGNSIYQGGGYYGGYVHSFSSIDGQEEWSASLGGGWDMYTPAVSRNYVLHHNGAELNAINRRTGEIEFAIDDGLNAYASHAYHGSPVVYNNIALAYAGGAFSGRASSNIEQYDERQLSAFDLEGKMHLWNSTNVYLTQPAVKDGVVYIGSKSLGRLDALDINTGEILWSWTPADSNETALHRNVVITDNLLFVSTNSKVHAIDLNSKLSVWSYPLPGMLAISENKTLFIATGMTGSDGRLVAIKLE